MGKRKVVFGEKEKHTLEISWSRWMGVTAIKIDGQWKTDVLYADLIPLLDPRRSYDYTVGTNEVHSVHVEVGYGVDAPLTTVTVDGKVIE